MGFRISSVNIPDISPYTKSEQPRIAEKHLTRLAKNGYSVVAISIPCVREPSYFLMVGDRCVDRLITDVPHI